MADLPPRCVTFRRLFTLKRRLRKLLRGSRLRTRALAAPTTDPALPVSRAEMYHVCWKDTHIHVLEGTTSNTHLDL